MNSLCDGVRELGRRARTGTGDEEVPRHLAPRLLRHVRDDAPDAVDLLDDRELNARCTTLTRRPPGGDVGGRAAVDDQPSRCRLVECRCEAGPPVRRIHLPLVGGHPVARLQRSELGRDDHDVARRAARQRRDVERGVQHPGVEPGSGRRRRAAGARRPGARRGAASGPGTTGSPRSIGLPRAGAHFPSLGGSRISGGRRRAGGTGFGPSSGLTPVARTGDAGRARSRRDP